MDIGKAFFDVLCGMDSSRYKRVLEVGCGEGITAEYIRSIADQLCLIDISDSAILKTCGKFGSSDNVSIYKTSLSRLVSEPFDLIYYFLSFHHIDNPVEELARVRERLLPDGSLIICELYSPEGKRFHLHDTVYCDAYHPDSLRSMLTEAGFRITTQKDVGKILHDDDIFQVYLIRVCLDLSIVLST